MSPSPANGYGKVHARDINLKPCEHCEGTGMVPRTYETGRDMMRRREAAGISLRALARTLKFSAAYVCDLEKGRRQWSMRLVRKYLNALAVMS